jgi:hypothetical protein
MGIRGKEQGGEGKGKRAIATSPGTIGSFDNISLLRDAANPAAPAIAAAPPYCAFLEFQSLRWKLHLTVKLKHL